MLKNNLLVFFGIFLVRMLFVPPSMPTAAAQDDVIIPHWIKNNAGWWADDQITDTDFVKGIKYLMDNTVLQIPTNQQSNEYGVLKLDSFQYELPKRNDVTTASIFGKFSDKQSGSRLTIQVTGPDGEITEENTTISKGTTNFNYQYLIKNDFPVGEYQLTIRNVDDNELGPILFTVKVKSAENQAIPFWIKNTAGWWASDAISDTDFVNALQFLVKEDIIKVAQKSVELPKGMDPDIFIYRTKLTKVPDVILNNKLIKTEPFTAIVVHSTQDEYCSAEEKTKTLDYAKMTEHLLNKFPRQSQPTEVIAVCMELHEIKGNTYPLTLKELGISSPKVVIYLGGLEANLESYDDESRVGWWSVNCTLGIHYTCASNQIIVCDECKRWFTLDTDSPIVNPIDFDDAIDRGMWTLAHEIGHLSHWEKSGSGLFYDGSNWVNKYAVSIHDNQRAFDYCYQQDILENVLCKKLYEKVKINDRIYTVMNIRYAINNWDGDQEDTLEGIKDLLGSGAQVEGFNRQTYSEDYEKDDEGQHILKPIFSIEYPDDWSTPDYNYNWYWYYGNGTTDPSKQNYEFNHEFPADNVLEKFGVSLLKEQSCTDCPQGYEYSFLLANTSVYSFENVHSVGESDEKILDVIENVEWKWCNSLTIGENTMECLDFKLKDKVVHLTDEGRKAYTVVYEYIDYSIDPKEPKNFQIKKVPTVYIASEIYDGNDAWHITTYADKDFFDKNPDQFYRFLESFAVIDYNTPP